MSERVQFVTIGELTIDDVVVEGVGVDWKQAGGGGLYSAVGAHLWSGDVGLNSVVGTDFPDDVMASLATAGLDVSAVEVSPAISSIGLWLLYESDGTRRQLEKRRGGTFAEVDAQRTPLSAYDIDPLGIHVAPQSSQGQLRALETLRGRRIVRTLDLLIEPGIDRQAYLSGEAVRQVDAFLPSEQEVLDLWGHADIRRLASWLDGVGSNAALVIKRGAAGVDVFVDGGVVRVPSVVETLLDPTGAGDAFCGGFLVGLVRTGDPIEAAVHGSVSASFVCETRGALEAMAHMNSELAQTRAKHARNSIREVK